MRAFFLPFMTLLALSGASLVVKAEGASRSSNQFTPVPGYENSIHLAADMRIKSKKPKLLCTELGGLCNSLSDCCSEATYCSFVAGCSLGTKCCN
jgi:hypothetical protein